MDLKEKLGYGNLNSEVLGFVAFGVGLGIAFIIGIVLYLIF